MRRYATKRNVNAEVEAPAIRLARWITHALAPAPVVGVLLVVIALHSSSTIAAALGWSILTVAFAVLIPFAYLLRGVRRHRFTDIHVRLREQRSPPLLVGIGSILISLGLLVVLGAPQELIALVAAMTAGLLLTLLVTLVWKISVHAAVWGGTVVILALTFGPAWLTMSILAGLVGWARVKLGDHSVSQVIAGYALGAGVAAVVFTLIR
ncbi:MAG TPA: hypothetical protein VKU87_09910 [Thermomicrobiaceae bacterium]|nr:hypothetical protein [Thermomicrobiaceae bacterium]